MLVTAVVTTLWVVMLLLVMGEQTNYALDDPYIHMSIARHWLEDGVWGIGSGPAAATSSPLWTVLIAMGFRLFGAWDLWPYLLQLPWVVALGVAVDRWMPESLSENRRAGTACALLLCLGLPALLLSSMEHILHVAVALFLVVETARHVDGPASLGRIALLSAIAIATRYESVFLLVGTGLVLVHHRRWGALAAGHGLAGGVAILIGVWNATVGVGPLPNSVVAKSAFIQEEGLGALLAAVSNIPAHVGSHETALLGAVVALVLSAALCGARSDDTLVRVGVVALTVTAVLHICFAQLGWLFRYEAWLIALGLVVTTRAVILQPPPSPVVRTLVAMAGMLVVVRLIWSTSSSLGALEDIRKQHLAMARVLDASFSEQVVVANDVGAISFYADIEVMDLVGLGDNEILEHRRKGTWGAPFLAAEATERKATIAVLYEDWFGANIPESWTPVADWNSGEVVIAGSPRVSWYAIGADPETVKTALQQNPPAEGVELIWR